MCNTAIPELLHPEGRSRDALVSEASRCLVYLPLALQFTVCSVSNQCFCLHRFVTIFSCRTPSTILEYFGSGKLTALCSMASPIDTEKPVVKPG